MTGSSGLTWNAARNLEILELSPQLSPAVAYSLVSGCFAQIRCFQKAALGFQNFQAERKAAWGVLITPPSFNCIKFVSYYHILAYLPNMLGYLMLTAILKKNSMELMIEK